ncbi:UDP-GlcNAc:betaGal beta-1,3-N-acetylglucosaminyltransferase 9-like [Drosophila pseudoobscura]|uniref:UDP-GlcNAc:betaGal beta-1,3-N-acetylglucosaminyltransferase 9-like n=1 Tax=Drosophila pseudoobscura pseudoobscura TaxID=46245 RepID=A0A6I8UIA4_DROPS|nr:UDP-GlcNAc:betaGal beta-1,3-N-acetylglucosaminyltransferase 9 [Drosophila pseudoobscura]
MVAVGNLHNTRMLRFLLVLVVVILTIFIYASYSTTATLTPTRVRPAASPPQQLVGGSPIQMNNTGEFGLATGEAVPKAQIRLQQQQQGDTHRRHPPQHRLPTIDEDALLDGGSAGASPSQVGNDQTPNAVAEEMLEEQQYGQSVDGITGNISSNNNNNISNSTSEVLVVKQPATGPGSPAQSQQSPSQQQQAQSDAEVLIPTSNLQKFIENADKILKNITSNSSSGTGSGSGVAAAANGNDQHIDKANQAPEDGKNEGFEGYSADSDKQKVVEVVKAPPSNPMKDAKKTNMEARRPPVPVIRTTKGRSSVKEPPSPVDPSKGVATEKLYESGHIDEEIDADRICPHAGETIKLLVLISSAQSHEAARMSIRQTWMHYGSRRDVSMAFVLGRGSNETLNKALTKENYIYGDLIRGNFIDSYNNLTLKTISSLEWADLHCPRCKYILKTDDDMFINVPKLLAFLDKHQDKRTIYGRLAKKWKPIRNKKSKYYVSVDQFAAGVFPSFTTGPAYVLTGDIVHELYVRSLKTVYLKLEDVFTTGIVAKSLDIKRVQVNEFVNRRISFNPCNIRNAISVHMIKSNEQFDLWKKLLDQTTKCK